MGAKIPVDEFDEIDEIKRQLNGQKSREPEEEEKVVEGVPVQYG